MTKDQANKYPRTFITDGLKSYKTAARSEFKDHTKHVSEIHISGFKVGKDNNNKMERLNGTIRDREKTFRGLGTKFASNFHGLRVHYKHARKHGALKMAPGEATGIKIDGKDKWATMIQMGVCF